MPPRLARRLLFRVANGELGIDNDLRRAIKQAIDWQRPRDERGRFLAGGD